jgi:hypothetical protein
VNTINPTNFSSGAQTTVNFVAKEETSRGEDGEISKTGGQSIAKEMNIMDFGRDNLIDI